MKLRLDHLLTGEKKELTDSASCGVSATVTQVLKNGPGPTWTPVTEAMPDVSHCEDQLWLRNSAAINVCDAAKPQQERARKYPREPVTAAQDHRSLSANHARSEKKIF